MGDRAMAEIKTDEGSLYFYTHWYGRNLPEVANKALDAAANRKGDYAYATKIVIDNLIKECNSRDDETGAGIMLKPVAEDAYNGDKPSVLIDLVGFEVTSTGHS